MAKNKVKSELAVKIGERIKEFRNAKHFSQEELAHLANMHTSHIGQIERGDKTPTLESLKKINDALQIDFEDLFNFKIIPKSADESLAEKISAYLSKLSVEQQKDMLKIIKVLVDWKENDKYTGDDTN